MKKRLFLFAVLLPAVLLLQLRPATACEHYPDIYTVDELILQGYVEPQVGVPGYSGDFCCPDPDCGEVCIPGYELPAKQLEAPKPAEDDDPEEPEEPEEPGEPDDPDDPENPGEPGKPEGQEEPGEPEEPEEPPAPGQERTETDPQEKEEPEKQPQVAPDRTAPKQSSTATASTEKQTQSTQNKQTSTVKEEITETVLPEGRFSRKYPWRRVKFRRIRKARAEAAGELLWKAPSTPFQAWLGE